MLAAPIVLIAVLFATTAVSGLSLASRWLYKYFLAEADAHTRFFGISLIATITVTIGILCLSFIIMFAKIAIRDIH